MKIPVLTISAPSLLVRSVNAISAAVAEQLGVNALAIPARRITRFAALQLAVSLVGAWREIVIAVVLVVAQPAPVDAGAAVAPELTLSAAAGRCGRCRAIHLVAVVPAVVLSVADPVQVDAGRRVVTIDDA